MNAAPESAELAPSRDPSAYARRPLLSGVFWVMMGFCALCLLAAALVVSLGPKLFPVRPAVAPAAAPPAAAPAPLAPQGAIAQDLPSPEPDLTTRVQRLEAGQSRIVDAAAEALAASTLSDAASRPRPFTVELNAASQLMPGSPDLASLAPLAQTGARTRPALAAELDDLGGQIAAAARAPGSDASFLDRLAYAFSRVVTVRRVAAGATGSDAVLVKAERAADEGDLESAVALLDSLPDSARQTLAPWRDQAERRIEIDRHIAAIRAQAAADLASAQGGQPASAAGAPS